MLRLRQLAHILANCGTRTLVTNLELLHLVLAAAEESPELRAIILSDAASVPMPLRHDLPYVRLEELHEYSPLTQATRIIDRLRQNMRLLRL